MAKPEAAAPRFPAARVLAGDERPVGEAAYELILLELYRRGELSGGRAAELLGIDRRSFMLLASSVGIPVFDMTEEEWETEARLIDRLVRIDSEPSPTPAR